MKKKIAAIALGAALGVSSASAAWVEDLSATATVAFESNYVFRGGQQYNDNWAVQPGLDFSLPVFEGSAYVGYWGSYAYGNSSSQGTFAESDWYIGYGQDLTEYVSIDGGFTYYGFSNSAQDAWKEIYLGLSFDGLMPEGFELSPAVYAYYNFSGDALTVEGSIGHSFSLEQLDPNLGLDLGAYLAYVDFGDANGDQVAGSPSQDYIYYGASADLVYTLNDVASVSAGVRYAGNDLDASKSNLYVFDSTDDILWWGVSTTFGF